MKKKMSAVTSGFDPQLVEKTCSILHKRRVKMVFYR